MKRSNHKELPCIYMILCLKNGRYYIGKTSDAWRRWEEHYIGKKFGSYESSEKESGKSLMLEDWRKYGRPSFAYICLCERSNKSFRDDLEAFLITRLNPVYNTMLSNAEGETAHFESAAILTKEFIYTWIPQCLKDMQGMTFFEWTKLWARLVELRATGLSNRKKSDFEKMLKEVYPEHFRFEGNKIARIKNFKIGK